MPVDVAGEPADQPGELPAFGGRPGVQKYGARNLGLYRWPCGPQVCGTVQQRLAVVRHSALCEFAVAYPLMTTLVVVATGA